MPYNKNGLRSDCNLLSQAFLRPHVQQSYAQTASNKGSAGREDCWWVWFHTKPHIRVLKNCKHSSTDRLWTPVPQLHTTVGFVMITMSMLTAYLTYTQLQESVFQDANRNPMSHVMWKSNQPGGSMGQNCIAMSRGEWDDRNCEDEFPPLCSTNTGKN